MPKNLSLAIKVGFDGSAVEKGLTRLQSQYRGTLAEMQSASGRLSAFGQLKRDTEEARKAWQQAQAEVARLAREMRGTEAPSKALAGSFAAAKREAASAKLKAGARTRANKIHRIHRLMLSGSC